MAVILLAKFVRAIKKIILNGLLKRFNYMFEQIVNSERMFLRIDFSLMNIKKILQSTLVAFVLSVALSAYSSDQKTARPTSEQFMKSVIYQIHLPIFTQGGTLESARQMLPHIASLGVDIVYLCPVVEADDDMDMRFWSKRQKESKTGNPKNPYRIKDYFKIDPQYGGDADLKNFVDTAHKLGLKVLLDLVYYHCGPTATMIKEHPDFVVRDEDGNVKNGRWNFPEINFKSRELREYLWKNMEYFVREFKVDGYRTDVEPSVPADFWAEGYKRIKKINPDVIMVAEGERADAQADAYDLNYSFKWQKAIADVFDGKKPATELSDLWEKQNKHFVRGARIMRALDNHDTASDSFDARYEKRWGNSGFDAVLALNFTMDGVPMIYNGNEISDTSNLCMFSNRFYGKYAVDWSNALTDRGKKRISFVRDLSSMRHGNPALYSGATNWLKTDNPENVLAFTRNCKKQNIFVAINVSKKDAEFKNPINEPVSKEILNKGATFTDGGILLKPYGFIVFQY